MTLRFYPRHDHCVFYPGIKTPNGQPPMYLGREFVRGEAPDAKTSSPGKPGMYPARKAPIECESGDEVATRIIRLMTIDRIDPPFFCADEATANATGLPFVKADFAEGVWSERAAPQVTPPAKAVPKPASE